MRLINAAHGILRLFSAEIAFQLFTKDKLLFQTKTIINMFFSDLLHNV